MEQIKDYLQTHGLRLNTEGVMLTRLAAETVMEQGLAHIEHDVLWYENSNVKLNDFVAENTENTQILQQIFMALDAAITRYPVQSAVVYGVFPNGQLLRLVQQGKPLEQQLSINEQSIQTHLAARSVQSGWLNLVDDVDAWLASGSLSGEENRRFGSQGSFPIHGSNGAVYGLLHIECTSKCVFDEEDFLAQWVGLSLALLPKLKALLPHFHENEEGSDE